MPFIEDDLLWCPNTDGKMVDLSCLDSGPNVMVEPQPDVLTELTHTDLHGLGIDEEEEILRQLADPAFEIDAIFADLDPRLEPHGAQAVAVGMVPGDDQAQSACRKRRRRRSEEPPPGCSGLQPFHQVTVKIEPGTNEMSSCIKMEGSQSSCSAHLPDSTVEIVGGTSLTQLSPCEESLHCLQTSAGQARYRALGSLYPTTGGRLQQDPAEGTAAGFISGRSLQGICSKNLPKTTLQVLCPLDLLSLLPTQCE
ncbi:hypothetical protein HPB47_011772 [Ixodes persulcatus]|uniref:Uncharacterized protein n=1 Tax=Ixodes persulcatus TaxID=34615 RepID=A0AC60NVI9_IXOPE|nr:hypothetical protein HPB47_011772 [Ixodes persulcatus]